MGRIWAVCSGSGGTGKSTIALSLAAGAAKEGKNVILLDVSGVSRSCDLILGLESIITLDMTDVLARQIGIDAALYPVSRYPGLRFACASLYDRTAVSELSGIVLALHSMCDLLVIDLPTGETEIGRGIMQRTDERILVTRPEPSSVRAAERLMRTIQADGAGISLVINRVYPERVKKGLQYSIDAVQNTLDRIACGVIPEDISVAACELHAVAALDSNGPAKSAFRTLVKTMIQAI